MHCAFMYSFCDVNKLLQSQSVEMAIFGATLI